MSFSIKYGELFSVKILHRYFLDKGTEEFRLMDENDRLNQLRNYNAGLFIKILPDDETTGIIKGHSMVFKETDSGFSVWIKLTDDEENTPFIEVEDDLNLTFTMQIKDSLFYNYTDLKSENREKIYWLSNRKPDTEPAGFSLIDEAGGTSFFDERFILSEEGQKNERLLLPVSRKTGLLGIIRIYMKGDKSELNITDSQNRITAPSKHFEVILKNRNTFWRYLYDSDRMVSAADDVKHENGNLKMLVTKNALPLTQSGFISVELNGTELPNPGVNLIKPDKAENKIFSEIYM